MKTRELDLKTDYGDLKRWWRTWSWPAVPEELLPGVGLIVESKTQKLAMGFLYSTDSDFAWIEWITGNPDADKFQRREALDILIDELSERAKADGFTTVFTTMKHPGLIERALLHGFVVTDKDMTNLVRRLS